MKRTTEATATATTKATKPQKPAPTQARQELAALVDGTVTKGAASPAVPAVPSPPLCSAESGACAHRAIKLGIDVHLDRSGVVRQIDGGAPQPPQRFSPVEFLEWAKKQTELADQVYSCYEAGPFGYRLHRKLTGGKITHYVVRPRDWDEYGKKVKTDPRDAKQLVLSLDR